jgi:hypothetical protein
LFTASINLGVDLVFGSNFQLRALAEVFAGDDSKDAFIKTFVNAWSEVMNLGCFDLSDEHISKPPHEVVEKGVSSTTRLTKQYFDEAHAPTG